MIIVAIVRVLVVVARGVRALVLVRFLQEGTNRNRAMEICPALFRVQNTPQQTLVNPSPQTRGSAWGLYCLIVALERLVYRDLGNRQEVILPQTSLKAQRADPARAGYSRRGPLDCNPSLIIRAPQILIFSDLPTLPGLS